MISDKDMEHLKSLARLEIAQQETQDLKEDLNKILESFEAIRHLDTDDVEELTRPVSSNSVYREDKLGSSLDYDRVQGLAIETEKGFFKVPRTVDSGE